MFMEKLQMLIYCFMNHKQKLAWLKQWNEFGLSKEAKKVPKQGFLESQFDKWLHKATF